MSRGPTLFNLALRQAGLSTRGQPFRRARIFAAAIAAINRQYANDIAAARSMLERLGPYWGRGKGEGLHGNKHSRHTVAQDKRAARKARNRRRA